MKPERRVGKGLTTCQKGKKPASVLKDLREANDKGWRWGTHRKEKCLTRRKKGVRS